MESTVEANRHPGWLWRSLREPRPELDLDVEALPRHKVPSLLVRADHLGANGHAPVIRRVSRGNPYLQQAVNQRTLARRRSPEDIGERLGGEILCIAGEAHRKMGEVAQTLSVPPSEFTAFLVDQL
jgi:hypothetical protein